MDKLDIVPILLESCLRIAYLLLQHVSPLLNYWLNPFQPVHNPFDVDRAWIAALAWGGFVGAEIGMWLIYALYYVIDFVLALPYRLPGTFLWTVIWFWPRFYWTILRDPGGRSILEILSDPTASKGLPQVNTQRRRPPTVASRRDVSRRRRRPAIETALQPTYVHDPLGLARLHDNVQKLQPVLPSNRFLLLLKLATMALVVGWLLITGIFKLQVRLLRRKLGLIPSNEEGGSKTSEGDRSSTSEGDVSTSRRRSRRGSRRWRQIPKGARRHGRTRTKRVQRHLTCLATDAESESRISFFDSDGIVFVIDNSANCIICNDRSMFPGRVTLSDNQVMTASGVSITQYVGTIRLRITDDEGVTTTYDVEGAVYDPKSPVNILGVTNLSSHFAKKNGDASGWDEGTGITTRGNRSEFFWDNGKHRRNFFHGDSHLPELPLNTGEGYFKAFCSRLSSLYNDNISYAFSSALSKLPTDERVVIEDQDRPQNVERVDFEDQDQPQTVGDYEMGMNLVYNDGKGSCESVVYEGAAPSGTQHVVRRKDGSKIFVYDVHLSFQSQANLTNLPSTPLDYCKEVRESLSKEEATKLAYPRRLSPLQQELLSWHFRLYHLPFWRIFELCEAGYLPKRLLKCKESKPLCVACQFGQAHRRPWRAKGKKSGSIRKEVETEPGDGTSVDQIVSAQPGLVPIMDGEHTSNRIWGATTFCDHVSNFVYVHLMRNFTMDETLLAKKAYEKLLHQSGHEVRAYHGDNGRFKDAGWVKDCNEKAQKQTLCGVGAHHQNGIIENRNKQLTNTARTLLLHAMRMWPGMIDTMFWPFALLAAAERINSLHLNKDGKSTPESKLHGVELSDIPVKNFQTLFCPVYVLDHRLHQAGSIGPPKWEPRSRIGIYLGHSPYHAGSVALVFNIRTGRVSPQYHVVFDSDFTTVPFMDRGEAPPNWSELCQYSTESYVDESVQLAEEWLSSQTDNDSDVTETRRHQLNESGAKEGPSSAINSPAPTSWSASSDKADSTPPGSPQRGGAYNCQVMPPCINPRSSSL